MVQIQWIHEGIAALEIGEFHIGSVIYEGSGNTVCWQLDVTEGLLVQNGVVHYVDFVVMPLGCVRVLVKQIVDLDFIIVKNASMIPINAIMINIIIGFRLV